MNLKKNVIRLSVERMRRGEKNELKISDKKNVIKK